MSVHRNTNSCMMRVKSVREKMVHIGLNRKKNHLDMYYALDNNFTHISLPFHLIFRQFSPHSSAESKFFFVSVTNTFSLREAILSLVDNCNNNHTTMDWRTQSSFSHLFFIRLFLSSPFSSELKVPTLFIQLYRKGINFKSLKITSGV